MLPGYGSLLRRCADFPLRLSATRPLAWARGVRRSKWSTGPFRLLRKPLLTHASALTRARGRAQLILFLGKQYRLARLRPGKGLGGLLIRTASQPTDLRTLVPESDKRVVQS